ncbi:MAG: choice-of-anchor Q domain-containing protein [Bacteroidia bacterium]
MSSFAQLTGTKSIPGDYASIAAAITDLNTQGVGGGGVIFNVAAGHTESSTADILLTATGTASNTITFQKDGAGNNPKITRTDAGSLATSTLGGQGDAVIIIEGSDYVTFNGIDVAADDEGIEYGYYLRKAGVDNGCKHVSILNAAITMTKGTSQYVAGIYSSNNDASSLVSSATGITVTSEDGRSENITINGNTISNVFAAIVLRGFNHSTAPNNFYDQNFTIGASGAGNTIQNYGGNASITTYGVYAIYHNDLTISHNNINNTAGGGSGFMAIGYGIFISNANNASTTITHNQLTLTSAGTTQLMHAINCGAGASGSGNTTTISNNTVQNCSYTTATSAAFTGIVNSTTGVENVTMENNIVRNNTLSGTGAFTGIDAGGGTSPGTIVQMNNNQVDNNTKTGASGSMFCIRAGALTVTANNNTIHTNGFDNSSGTGSAIIYGYYNFGSPTSETITNNTIYNLFVDGANTGASSIISGIHTNTTASATKEIRQNTIYDLSAQSGVVQGILHTLGTTVNIHRNRIYGLSNASTVTTSARVMGISHTSGSANIYNNAISELSCDACAGDDAIRGISTTSLTSSANTNLYFNTVYLNTASGGANFGSSALFHSYSLTATTATLDIRNNIFVNNAVQNGTGKTVAFRRSASTNLNNFSTNSNNNAFYAGTPGANNVIFREGTTDHETIADYKTRVSPAESVSFTENVNFANTSSSPYNLSLNTATPTQCESGGQQISSPAITIDFAGTIRALETGYAGTGTQPDVGAYEGEYTGLDLTPPVISYTPLSNSASTSARTLTAEITDASGIPTAGSGLPVLYWSINNAAGPFTSATGTHTTGNNYEFSFGAGVGLADVVHYYIVAQDEAGTPNVSANPSAGAAGFSTSPPAASTPPTTPNAYTIVGAFSGTYAVGPGETYTTLTGDDAEGFFKALNEGAATGNIIVEITDDITEAGTIALNQIADDGNGYTLTIRPNAASMRTISGNFAGGLIRLNGADRVTIDGSSSGGTDRNLTIRNDSSITNSAAIQIISLGNGEGATHNTIKNCILNAGNIGTTTSLNTFAIFIGGAAISNGGTGADNNNNTIENNIISKARFGVYARGASLANSNENLKIIGNEIGSSDPTEYVTFRGIDITNANEAEISGNNIFNLKQSLAVTNAGIDLGAGVRNSTISKNIITGIHSESTSGYGAFGINVSSATNVDANTISNNAISDIRTVNYSTGSTSFNAFGIRLVGGTNTSLYYNSVHLTGNVTIVSGIPTQPNSAALVVTSTSVTGLNMVNNSFSNQQSFVSGSPKTYSVWFPTSYAGFGTVNNNIYHGSTNAPGTYYVGRVGTTDYADLADWQGFTTQDANSLGSNPAFNGETNLKPQTGSAAIGAGVAIAGITTDIENIVRNATTPTIGAYEQAVDVSGPNFSFTTLANTSSTAARTLTVEITDPSGVPTAGAGLPVLYWSINNIAGPFTAATATHLSGNDYEFTFGAGVSANDVVHYYIVAQDLVGTPNVGASPEAGAAGFSSNPPAASTPPSTPHNYRIAQAISGIIAVGTGETYTSLSANSAEGLFKAINDNVVAGNLIVEITSNLTETGEEALNQWVEEGAGNYTLTIRPSDANTKVIEGSFAGGLIRLSGADRVTIDGRFSGTGQHLTFRNNSTAANTAAIQLASLGTNEGATDNTIRNCIIEAGSITVTSTFGIFAGGSLIGTAGTGADNDNLTIRDNIIRKAYYGIYAAGVASTGVMDDLTIENNTIGSSVSTDVIANRGIRISNATDALVSGNTIFGFRTASVAIQITGIEFAANVTNSKISRNEIYDIVYTATSFRAGQGIAVFTVADANVEISNNVIYGLGGHGSATALNNSWGIMIMSGGGINVHYNSINQTATFNSATNIHGGIYVASGTTTLNISNNLVASQAASGTFYNIYSLAATTAYSSLDRNLYFIPGSTPASTTRHTGFLTSAHTTLANWQTATSLEANSLSADPLFTSATNLHPTSGSPAIGAGQVVSGITVDFLGNTRSGTSPSIGAYETALINSWNGTGLWTDAANWSLGVPAAGDNGVVASGTLEIPAGTTINNITINSGAVVNIPSATSLTVNGALSNNGTLNVLAGGHLIQGASSTIGGTGTFNATRNSGNSSNLVYNMWSSPNSTSTLGDLGGTDWYLFDGAAQAWSNTGLNGSTTMAAGTGYSATGAGSVTFNGTFNNGAVSPAVSTSGQGWNLVGNPYPSTVDGADFFTANSNIEGTLWFWSQPTAATVGNSGGDYATWTTLGGTAGSAGGATPDGNIGLGQGFFVKANSGTEVSFANSMRTANTGSNFRTVQAERAWFNLTNTNGLFNQILVGFSAAASDQRDAMDALKFKGNSQIALYSLLGSEELAIQALAERTQAVHTIALGFDVATAGAYSFSLDRLEDMPSNVDVMLEDKLTNTMHNLRAGAYGFAATQAGSFTNRFEVHFGVGLATSVADKQLENVHIYSAGNTLFIRGHENMATDRFELRDASGRLVSEIIRPQADQIAEMRFPLAEGVYLARLINSQGVKTVKVYLSK